MAIRSRVPVRSRAPKRKTVWVGTADQGAVSLASGGSAIVSSFDPSSFAILKATIARVRGEINVFPQVTTADLSINGAYGLCVVSDEAFAAGAASIPRPFDDDDWAGWLVHGYFSNRVIASAVDNGLWITSKAIDSKAMRKVGPGETVVWMIESQGGAISVLFNARVLIMLS